MFYSSVSSSLNATAAVLWDVLKKRVKVKETTATTLIKLMGEYCEIFYYSNNYNV
jgi:hypothetical protein